MPHRFQWTVSQIGAREHYGVPRGFLYKSNLRTLYTDAWCRWGARTLVRRGPQRVRAFASRWHPHIPARKVVAFTTAALMSSNLVPPGGVSTEALFEFYIRQGKWFAERVARHLSRQRLDPACDHFFAYDSAALETLELLKARGVFTVVDQMDPARVEEQIVFAETAKWPGWQQAPGRIPESYFRRLSREWDVADMVLVNSDWSRSALLQQGVPAEKVCVVPLAYEPESVYVRPKDPPTGPLNVLWLGRVNLRKGIPYLLEAARQLPAVRFTVAGPLDISQQAVASAPSNVEFIGRVTRDRTAEVYRAADVFVLPTLSDGFALTQLEAMSHGLPVVTTPNCGQVVTDGVDGLIVPAGDAGALAAALGRLDAERGLIGAMSRQAIDKVGRFRLPNQCEQIEAEVLKRRGTPGGGGGGGASSSSSGVVETGRTSPAAGHAVRAG